METLTLCGSAGLLGALSALKESLLERGSDLVVRQGPLLEVLPRLVLESGAAEIIAEEEVEYRSVVMTPSAVATQLMVASHISLFMAHVVKTLQCLTLHTTADAFSPITPASQEQCYAFFREAHAQVAGGCAGGNRQASWQCENQYMERELVPG